MIKINKIKIKDYKSIYDSKDIIIQDRITVFAGKNESGKTNILKALETYYNDDFSQEDVPTKDENLNPTVSVDFSISGDYFNSMINRKWLDDGTEYSYTIEKSKEYKDSFSGRLIEEINKNLKLEIETDSMDLVRETIKNILSLTTPQQSLDEKDLNEIIYDIIRDMIFDNEDTENIIKNKLESRFGLSLTEVDVSSKIVELAKILNKDKALDDLAQIYSIIMPEFKYFDNFNDMLPDEIDISELKEPSFKTKYRGFINLLAYLGVTLDDFTKDMSEKSRGPQTKLDKYSDNITLDYQSIYKQEKLKIALKKDGEKIYVNIYDVDDSINPKKPSQRSKGLQWFLSFYLMLHNSNENAILLIDEPGLYLHASAQEDILRFFEHTLTNYILYTTHSPYLIDTNNMLRIKLVTNDRTKGKGTLIENKYYNCSDLDTITPIITAIGYNVARSPLEFGGGLNVITEGVSDRYYLLAFLKMLNINDDISIIPSKGSSTIHLLVSMSIGWGLNYIVFLDNDEGYKDAKDKLLDFYETEEKYEEYVYKVIRKQKSCIEDIFSAEDKKIFGIGSKRKDKILNAKRFYDMVQKEEKKFEDLHKETQENISYVIQIINSKK